MKIEFPVLQSEPLIYFLVHGGVFVLIMAGVFFALGVWFGAAVWGRYKSLSQALRAENEGQREEIATLKRKLAEQGLRPQSGPLPQPAHLLTEILPSVSEVFPERAFHYPALAALPPLPSEPATSLTKASSVPASLASDSATLNPPDSVSAVTQTSKVAGRKGAIKAKPKKDSAAGEVRPPTPGDLQETGRSISSPRGLDSASMAEETAPVEPFGFLLNEPVVEEPLLAPSASSALSAIIQGSPLATESTSPTSSTPTLSMLPEIKVVLPEVDPALGPIYKEPPPDADDLTRIKGIASVLEKRLHELGIHTYRQIASWDETHIREFSSRLAFKDRIVREKWVEQARSLNESRQSA